MIVNNLILAVLLFAMANAVIVENAKSAPAQQHAKAPLNAQPLATKDDEAPENPISPMIIPTVQNCSGHFGTYCHDCRSIVICAGDEKPIYQGTCPSTAPYCDNSGGEARCKSTTEYPLDAKMCEEGTQRCTSRGYFPDIYDSQIFHFCEGEWDLTPQRFSCPDNYIYDSYTQGCQRITPFDCTGKDNQFVSHAVNRAYYVFCKVDGGIREMIPFKCRDELNFIYNTETNACEYQCKGEGRFVDRESCEHYYECYRTNGGFTHQRVKCGGGYHTYDKTIDRCIPYYSECSPEAGW